jgi:phage gpG-like protein
VATGTGTEITFDPKDALDRLQKFGRSINPRIFAKIIGQEYLSWINRNFKAEGLERKWDSLTSLTLLQRRKEGKGAKILRDTGALAQSFTPGNKDSEYKLTDTSVSVGSAMKIAEYHHEGRSGGWDIRPKNKKGLAFFLITGFKVNKSGKVSLTKGKSVFGKVRHPGLKSRPLIPSNTLAESIAQDVIEKTVERRIQEAGL